MTPTAPEFIVESCSVGDVPIVSTLDYELWKEWGLPVTFYRQLLDVGPDTIVVAKEPLGTIIGYAVGIVKAYGTSGHIFSVDVRPEFRRFGIARAMVARLLSYFDTNGAAETTAMIDKSNLPSQRLFEGFGFVRGELEVGYFGKGHDYYRFHRVRS